MFGALTVVKAMIIIVKTAENRVEVLKKQMVLPSVFVFTYIMT